MLETSLLKGKFWSDSFCGISFQSGGVLKNYGELSRTEFYKLKASNADSGGCLKVMMVGKLEAFNLMAVSPDGKSVLSFKYD